MHSKLTSTLLHEIKSLAISMFSFNVAMCIAAF